MSYMRYAIFLLISALLLSCQQNLDIQGFWVGVDEDGNWNDQTIEVTSDSIYIYDYFGIPLKSTYSLTGSKIKSGTTYQLFSDERFNEGGEVDIEIFDDTLYWKLSSTPDKYVRSRFNSYVEHYANSKGLRIDLPASDLFKKLDHNNLTYLDLFIGYDSASEVQIILDYYPVESFDLLPDYLTEHSIGHGRYALRLFADKSIDSSYILQVREAIKKTGIHLLQNVTKPSARRLVNLQQNPYSNYFYGATTVVRTEPKIVEIAE